MSPIADLVINLIADHPVAALFTPMVTALAWLGLDETSRRIKRRREERAEARSIRQLELFANDPDNHRKETP